MNTDIFFTQGTTHRVCQDYALSNPRNKDTGEIIGMPYVVVCDGCSGARHVDIGARLLALAAVQNILDREDGVRNNLGAILATADVFRRSLGLAVESLSSTLLTATQIGNYIEACCVGDGCILAHNKTTDMWELRVISFPRELPYYLRYELKPSYRQAYLDEYGWKYIPRLIEVYHFDSIEVQSKHEIANYFCVNYTHRFPLDEYDIVAVATDGVGDFQHISADKSGTTPVLNIEVLRELLAFKNFAGTFVQRRCNRAFKTFHANNWQNLDDVGIGAITSRE